MQDSEGGNIYYGRQIRAESPASQRRKERNAREADELERQGYRVERNLHPNGAYFAVIGNTHQQHEIEVGRIFAENGFAFTLDRENNVKIKLKSGESITLPSLDGRVEGFSHEISAFDSKRADPRNVTDAIKHSRKASKRSGSYSIQADIAITVARKGSSFHRQQIKEGVDEYKRQVRTGQTQAKPIMYLHVNETTRAIYYWNIKP